MSLLLSDSGTSDPLKDMNAERWNADSRETELDRNTSAVDAFASLKVVNDGAAAP